MDPHAHNPEIFCPANAALSLLSERWTLHIVRALLGRKKRFNEIAREIGQRITDDFIKDHDEGGVDEVHVVFTRFVSMVTQDPDVIRLLPLEVVEGDQAPDDDEVLPLYEFEPSADQVLDALLPKYVQSRLFNALLQSAASELAARQRAMKSATDNAEELIRKYTRLANQSRQAEITQEISEIVGGVEALASAK